jgi:hypothetical protein
MSINITTLTWADDLQPGSTPWDLLTSTDGWVRVVNHGPCPVCVSQVPVSVYHPPTELAVFAGVTLRQGESVLVPSDDGTSGTRVSIRVVTDTFLTSSAQAVDVIANGG